MLFVRRFYAIKRYVRFKLAI